MIRLSNSLIAVSGAEKAARARRVTGRIRYGWRPNALIRRKKAEYFARLTQFDNTEGAYAGHCEHIIWQPHKMTSIFPVQKKEYLGVQILVPANPEEFAALPVGTGQEEAYANRLEALGRVGRLCEKKQIQYTVMGMLSSDCSHYEECGEETKLAAWQIGLMREDYEKAVRSP